MTSSRKSPKISSRASIPQHIKKSKLIRQDIDVTNLTIKAKDEKGKVSEMKRKKKFFQKGKNLISFGFWGNKKLKKNPEKAFVITMFFANGTKKSFIIKTTESTFMYRKKAYYLYYEESWFDISLNQYHLFYHENYAVPINREVMQTGNEAFFNVTPENLKDLIAFEYVKVLAGAHTITGALKTLLILNFVELIGVVIMVISLFLKVKT